MIDIAGLHLNAEDRYRLLNPNVGGVILFARNFQSRQQLCQLTQQIRGLRSPELLIAVDQEGGRVQRFAQGFTHFPPMAVFGQAYDGNSDSQPDVLSTLRASAQLLAQELIECGLDLSFAPVLDLGRHEQTIIGDRALHADPKKLIPLAAAFVEGFNAAGMQATGKHFPGHGNVVTDSHRVTPQDQRSLAQIQAQDMQPYVALKDRLGAVMTAHIDFSCVDDGLPTYSHRWLQQILRQQIGFSGLIFSDDLVMCGAHAAGNITQRAERALAAGCDMILVCNDSVAVDALLEGRCWLASKASQARFKRMKAQPKTRLNKAEVSQIQTKLQALVRRYQQAANGSSSSGVSLDNKR